MARIADLHMSVAAARRLTQSADASKAVGKTRDIMWMLSKHWKKKDVQI